jgi:LCP family protein required for cell wall assembly
VYGRGNDLGGSEGMKQAIADLLQVPVHYFVKINYDGAAAIIDTIGGVEVNVFKKMEYDDIYAEPELHINIEEGLQVLDGKNSVDYLRWRQNNDLLDKEGDLPRITRMQNFMKAVAKQSINSRLPSTIQACFRYVYTDIEFDFASTLAVKGIGIDDSDIKFKRLPGYVEGYFYEIDQVETLKYLLDMYKNSDTLNQ